MPYLPIIEFDLRPQSLSIMTMLLFDVFSSWSLYRTYPYQVICEQNWNKLYFDDRNIAEIEGV